MGGDWGGRRREGQGKMSYVDAEGGVSVGTAQGMKGRDTRMSNHLVRTVDDRQKSPATVARLRELASRPRSQRQPGRGITQPSLSVFDMYASPVLPRAS